MRNYRCAWKMRTVRAIGLELMLTAEVDGLPLRRIIDYFELDDDGGLVALGKTRCCAVDAVRAQAALGVHIYSLLCEELLGRRPAALQRPARTRTRPSPTFAYFSFNLGMAYQVSDTDLRDGGARWCWGTPCSPTSMARSSSATINPHRQPGRRPRRRLRRPPTVLRSAGRA